MGVRLMARLVTHRKRRDPFIRIDRDVMEDVTLSFKAKALYAWLLDKGEFPGGWDTDVDRIALITADASFAIRSALNELQEARRLERVDSGAGGRGKRAEWHVYDEPKHTENREVKDELSAETASDERGNRDLTPHYRETSLSKTNTARAVDGFEAFWFAYPRKLAKAAALKAWRLAVRKTSASAIMSGLAVWAPIWEARGDLSYTPYPATWLNGERWNDEPTAVVDRQVLSDADFDAAWAKATAGTP